jgi:four helix bundle protein
MRPHHNLEAWSKSVDLVIDVYKGTERFPKEERYGLTSQIRRAAVSIPANIAEGAGPALEERVCLFSLELAGINQ